MVLYSEEVNLKKIVWLNKKQSFYHNYLSTTVLFYSLVNKYFIFHTVKMATNYANIDRTGYLEAGF